jgi:2-methylcitrate dehydratase PrpD
MAMKGKMLLACVLASGISIFPLAAGASPQCQAGAPNMLLSGSIAGALGEAVAKIGFSDLSSEVLHRTKLALLDNIATLAYSSRAMKGNPYLERAATRGGAREARVVGTGLRLPAEDAGATYAWLIHAAETDDSDFRASLRASPVVMAPALAMASAQHSSGQDFLVASAIGYTVLGRIAQPLGPLQIRGWMSSGVWGPTSAAAVSAKLLELDGAATGNAIALAASAGGGAFQYFYDQTEDKRMVVARATRSGIEAAALACQGEIGAARVFEGRAGLYANMGANPSQIPTPEIITRDFNALEGPLRIAPKFYAASASIIPFLDAIKAEPALANIAPSDIVSLDVTGGAEAARVYQDKIDRYTPPTTLIGAKTSLPYVLAIFLTRKSADTFDFTMPMLSDPALNALADKATFTLTPNVPTKLAVRLANGQTIEMIPIDSNGTSDEAENRAARLAKFTSLTRNSLNDRQRAEILAEVEGLDNVPDMAIWLDRLDRSLRRR